MEYFFELLQVSVGNRQKLSHPLDVNEWKKLSILPVNKPLPEFVQTA